MTHRHTNTKLRHFINHTQQWEEDKQLFGSCIFSFGMIIAIVYLIIEYNTKID